MSKIVFFCIPAYGHTNPTLGVVRELTARGHEVRYYSYEPMRTLIEAAGAQFVACDPYDCEQHLTPADGARVGKDIAFSTHILVETTLALDEMVCADMRAYAPDCIVADSMAVWGKAVAKKLGIPFISSTTTFAFNRYSAKVMKQSGGQMLKMMLAMPKINHDLQRLRDRGYPIKNILDIIQNDDRTDTIVYTSPEFQPCADTFSDKYAFVGPSIRPATETVEKTRDVLIYISMGTVNNDLLPFYRACIAAFADSPYQVILSTGDQVNRSALGTLPDNITALPHVDQIAVLQKADVFLSHCGMNSASESLYFGVPLVLFPQTNEQGGVAARVAELARASSSKKPTPPPSAPRSTPFCKHRRTARMRRIFVRASSAAAARKQRWIEFFLSLTENKFPMPTAGANGGYSLSRKENISFNPQEKGLDWQSGARTIFMPAE